MTNKEIIPGCGNCNSFTGVCKIMFQKDAILPFLAKKTLIDPPGTVEGPTSHRVKGFICTVSGKPELQQNCDQFIVRTNEDDAFDENI